MSTPRGWWRRFVPGGVRPSHTREGFVEATRDVNTTVTFRLGRGRAPEAPAAPK